MYRYLLLIGVLVLASCGSKKRLAEKKKHPKKEVVTTTPTEELTVPDTDAFVVFEIESTDHYISTFSKIAQEEMRAYGIPASITLAQGILESGSGRGELTKKTNNHFGIKCHTGWTGPRDYHDDDEEGECFRKYSHPIYSFRDHSEFLAGRGRYASLFELRLDNYKGWARGLKKAGYATDPRYPQKLISLIERYQLYKFDREVLREGKLAVKPKPKETTWVNYIVKKGDTLYAISKRFNVSVNDIKSINGLTSNDLNIGQLLVIKKPITSK